jgi:hypothetical protein
MKTKNTKESKSTKHEKYMSVRLESVFELFSLHGTDPIK